MSELKIQREHQLGLHEARAQARRWQVQAERDWGLDYVVRKGPDHDEIHFKRRGVSGVLHVSATRFELHLKLSALLGPLAGKIERGIRESLDKLLGTSA